MEDYVASFVVVVVVGPSSVSETKKGHCSADRDEDKKTQNKGQNASNESKQAKKTVEKKP